MGLLDGGRIVLSLSICSPFSASSRSGLTRLGPESTDPCMSGERCCGWYESPTAAALAAASLTSFEMLRMRGLIARIPTCPTDKVGSFFSNSLPGASSRSGPWSGVASAGVGAPLRPAAAGPWA